jgi:hypothetical protein
LLQGRGMTARLLDSGVTDWLTAIGTVGAVALALFFAFVEKIWQRPRLEISVNFKPPDCGMGVPHSKALFLRLRVANRGRSAARSLEATIQQMCQREGDFWIQVPSFLPSNLLWTHVSAPILPNLLPGLERNLDLAQILEPTKPSLARLAFILSVVPAREYNVLDPGAYRFSVTVGAENAKAVTQVFELTLSGKWFADEDKMLSDGVRLKVASAIA